MIKQIAAAYEIWIAFLSASFRIEIADLLKRYYSVDMLQAMLFRFKVVKSILSFFHSIIL